MSNTLKIGVGVFLFFGLFILSIVLIVAVPISSVSEEEDSEMIREDIRFNLPELEEVFQPCYVKPNGQRACIPNVLCPGIMKSGTSFLYYTLIHHPNIARGHNKEVNFFIDGPQGYDAGFNTYASKFPDVTDQIIIDVSPKYMMRPDSAELIYNMNRHMKFIVILRDPVDRTYSHFRYMQQKYMDDAHQDTISYSTCPNRAYDVTFKEYISEELEVLEMCGFLKRDKSWPYWAKENIMPKNCTLWRTKSKSACSSTFPLPGVHLTTEVGNGYMLHSFYYTIIKHYLEYFPKESFYFIRFEDILDYGEVYVLNGVVSWLGLPELTEEEWGEVSGQNSRDYPPIDSDEEDFLKEIFHEQNEQLYKLIDKNFGWK